jgi:uncharacterized protein HemX
MNQTVVDDKERAAAKPSPAPSGRGVARANLALMMIIGVAVAWLAYATFQRASATRAALAEAQARIAAAEIQIRAADAAAAQQRDALRELETRVADTERTLGRRGWDWLLAEAEYLLSLANEQLLLNRNITVAIAALEAADERLRRAGVPATLVVRNEIIKSIAALRAAERPDVPGHALKIAALIEQARRYPPARAQAIKTGTPEDGATEPAQPPHALGEWWRRLTALIVVRRSDKALPALLAPEEVLLLRLNLELQLESARAALLRNDPVNFAVAIRGAREWLAEYFDGTAPEVAAAVEQLRALEGADVALRVPDVSAPLNALRNVRSQLDVRASRPAKAAVASPSAPEAPP